MELAAVRAGLPLKFTQGFNPHPILSLPAPRPVGVASRDELLVIHLEAPRTDEEVSVALSAQVPRGLRILGAAPLESRSAPRPQRADYVLPLDPSDVHRVQERLDELERQPVWMVDRWTSPKGRPKHRGPGVIRQIDVRPLLADLVLAADRLRWSAVPRNNTWARPTDLLKLLGLAGPAAVADVVRTAVQYSQDESAGAKAAPTPSTDNPETKDTHAKKNAD